MPGIWQRMDQLKFSFRTISPLESAGLGKTSHISPDSMGILHIVRSVFTNFTFTDCLGMVYYFTCLLYYFFIFSDKPVTYTFSELLNFNIVFPIFCQYSVKKNVCIEEVTTTSQLYIELFSGKKTKLVSALRRTVMALYFINLLNRYIQQHLKQCNNINNINIAIKESW